MVGPGIGDNLFLVDGEFQNQEEMPRSEDPLHTGKQLFVFLVIALLQVEDRNLKIGDDQPPW